MNEPERRAAIEAALRGAVQTHGIDALCVGRRAEAVLSDLSGDAAEFMRPAIRALAIGLRSSASSPGHVPLARPSVAAQLPPELRQEGDWVAGVLERSAGVRFATPTSEGGSRAKVLVAGATVLALALVWLVIVLLDGDEPTGPDTSTTSTTSPTSTTSTSTTAPIDEPPDGVSASTLVSYPPVREGNLAVQRRFSFSFDGVIEATINLEPIEAQGAGALHREALLAGGPLERAFPEPSNVVGDVASWDVTIGPGEALTISYAVDPPDVVTEADFLAQLDAWEQRRDEVIPAVDQRDPLVDRTTESCTPDPVECRPI